ncbi:hypothetical protein BDR03DRAFT_1016844 [Suillus americanus]|nr:hypothetical protein BDR03DRAFT_1016844 [Suillus americanus]
MLLVVMVVGDGASAGTGVLNSSESFSLSLCSTLSYCLPPPLSGEFSLYSHLPSSSSFNFCIFASLLSSLLLLLLPLIFAFLPLCSLPFSLEFLPVW